jgi:alpha-galactosidase
VFGEPAPPFSFRYGGRESGELLARWEHRSSPAGEVFRDPATALEVKLTREKLPPFDAESWLVEFTNRGAQDSPMLEAIEPLDWTETQRGPIIVHHAKGSKNSPDDFAPQDDPMPAGGSLRVESTGGRSSQGSLPYFNIQSPDRGYVVAVGWTGNWRADFAAAPDGRSWRMTAGMKRTHLILHPGETIRTPRITLLRWSGTDWRSAQNRWRQLVLQYYTPQVDGHPLVGPVSFGTWGADSTAHKLAQIELVRREHLPFDIYWVDAGWYGNCEGHAETDPHPFWRARGSWVPNPANYPQGLQPVSDATHAAGMKFLLWLEPEEADPDTLLRVQHPEWFFSPPLANNPGSAIVRLDQNGPRAGLTDLVSTILTEDRVDWYRQDFNTDPERAWAANDAPNREGMTEIRYIEGLYRFLDDLKARHPNLMIDNCASGGQRLDIEMLRRTAALWRSDHAGPPDGELDNQTQTQGLDPWVPFNGSVPWINPGPFDESSVPPDRFDARLLYVLRGGYSAAMVLGIGQAESKDPAWCAGLRQALAEYREVQPCLQGDFYPLLPYSRKDEVNVAWQWQMPDGRRGTVIALRRSRSPGARQALALHAIDPTARYAVEVRHGLDHNASTVIAGRELANLTVDLPEAPGSALVLYRRVDDGAR